MSSSMTGSTGAGRTSTGMRNEKLRGVDPSMKHIPGHHRFQQFTPDQMNLFQQMFSHLGPESYLGRLAGGDEEMFNEIEAPAMRQFQGGLGQLASKFSGMGMGARRSSGFQNTSTSAMSQFAQDLQAQRHGLQRQAIMDLMGLSNQLLGQQPYGLQEKQQRQSSGWGSLIGQGVGSLGGFLLGGPGGAMAGAQLGGQVGGYF